VRKRVRTAWEAVALLGSAGRFPPTQTTSPSAFQNPRVVLIY